MLSKSYYQHNLTACASILIESLSYSKETFQKEDRQTSRKEGEGERGTNLSFLCTLSPSLSLSLSLSL